MAVLGWFWGDFFSKRTFCGAVVAKKRVNAFLFEI